ncbi:hypothetical protein EZS27_000337 [termite gut metagenome]|uniref:Phage integrase SAM-like domain-containing protein n=1 Tax=termite gut metagenome TaxID=433724 RepID=A0A5J4T236_9ZZZZ
MPTFKIEIQNKRADGTYNVRIRIIHNREVRRLSTNIYVTNADLTRSLKLKNQQVIERCEFLIQRCREACNKLDYGIMALPIDELINRIKTHLTGGNHFHLDFIKYTKQKTIKMNPGTASTYLIMLNALQRYIKCDHLDITEINTAFLRGFENFIENEPSMQGSNRKKEKKEIKPKSGRAISAYLACIRAIHNKAKEEFNDEDRGLIHIPYSPFKNFKIKPQPKTRKRAISVEIIQSMINLPYEKELIGGRWSRFNLAKDCFLLSFALIGMNSVDMYYANIQKQDIIIYNRRKTEGRRNDSAEMHVKIENCISQLIVKYRDPGGNKLFNFYSHYATPFNFNKALNKGLKQIGKILDIEGLEFYAARHSWATIARSSAVGIDKATVHEALNHVDNEMKVTDIYIDRDWSVIWNANKKVLELFDWKMIL